MNNGQQMMGEQQRFAAMDDPQIDVKPKKKSKMQPGDEIIKYKTDKDGKNWKVVKRIVKEKVYLT